MVILAIHSSVMLSFSITAAAASLQCGKRHKLARDYKRAHIISDLSHITINMLLRLIHCSEWRCLHVSQNNRLSFQAHKQCIFRKMWIISWNKIHIIIIKIGNKKDFDFWKLGKEVCDNDHSLHLCCLAVKYNKKEYRKDSKEQECNFGMLKYRKYHEEENHVFKRHTCNDNNQV